MSHLPPLRPRPPDCSVPLTAVQRWYWQEIVKVGTGASPFRIPAAFLRFSGPLNISRLTQSVQQLAIRHDALRTRVVSVGGQPQQIIDRLPLSDFPIMDLSCSAFHDPEKTARDLAKDFLAKPIDISSQCAFDVRVLKLSDLDHVLMVVVDHIVSDAISWSILTRDLLAFLDSREQPLVERLPTLSLQFSDYAVWQHMTNEAWTMDHGPYWTNRLSNFAKLTIPRDRYSCRQRRNISSVVYSPFGKNLTTALHDAAQREQQMLPLVILSLYLIVMSRWCERRDLLVNFLSHGRRGHAEFKNMIGCLAYSAFFRVEILSTECLRDVLARVTREFRGALAHDASRVFGTGLIADDSTELYFNWLPADWAFSGTYPAKRSDQGVKVDRYPVTKEMVAEFTPFFLETPSGILLVTWYDSDQFLKETAELFAARMRAAANAFVRDPSTVLNSLDTSE